MNDWIKVGTRYINLGNVSEVRLHEQPRFARIYFVHGATVDLDEDDTDTLLQMLDAQLGQQAGTRRTILAP